MTTILHIPAQHDAPIACDMRAAVDTPQQRLNEYKRLFSRALRRRERRDDAVIFTFADGPENRTWIADLAHREAACCPFIDSRVEAMGDELVWTMSGPATAEAQIALDAIHDLVDGSPLFGERGVTVIERGGHRFEMRA